MTNRDDGGVRDAVEAGYRVIVVDIVGLVEDDDERFIDNLAEKLPQFVNRGTSSELIGNVCRVLPECVTKNCTGLFTQTPDMCVCDRNTGAQAVKCMPGENSFPDAAGSANQRVVWARAGEGRLEGSRELTHLGLAMDQFSREVAILEDPAIDIHIEWYLMRVEDINGE
jgi:hypothetical protein